MEKDDKSLNLTETQKAAAGIIEGTIRHSALVASTIPGLASMPLIANFKRTMEVNGVSMLTQDICVLFGVLAAGFGTMACLSAFCIVEEKTAKSLRRLSQEFAHKIF